MCGNENYLVSQELTYYSRRGSSGYLIPIHYSGLGTLMIWLGETIVG